MISWGHVEELVGEFIYKFEDFLRQESFHRKMDAAFGGFVVAGLIAIGYGHLVGGLGLLVIAAIAMACSEVSIR